MYKKIDIHSKKKKKSVNVNRTKNSQDIVINTQTSSLKLP